MFNVQSKLTIKFNVQSSKFKVKSSMFKVKTLLL